ncbi:Undecaprenyl-phosphate 4-deoxy-4-formamido-L-arabinose transferase [Sedimentisphaera cyanobacteriorum]|uniref:Undecaprenyl-phosphate 4-deoxy-4-formamido-L-arabinose transferase n=1 Tax=Sedimentisphaera cyanobacteriorum TaxID=1940790 RepID=A0A1Q2HNH5_9BACT|nr:glycosyltransferase family 2 protein [Sedimentisphaera cyanobacteriorum]AQQ08900.1 Undecaprenyl-phosphate 4-deoxy-4-formamido-L-arabinose transferase [Sedimentisphaera cyanobacteriorum]
MRLFSEHCKWKKTLFRDFEMTNNQPAVETNFLSENDNGELVSVVVPTFKEAENVPLIVRKIHKVLTESQIPHEIILVDDDSQDGSVEEVEKLQQGGFPAFMIVRKGSRDLSLAVIEGFNRAKGSVLVCMDADLSHPADVIPELVSCIKQDEADFAIGSRYVEGASIEAGWSVFRHLNSKISKSLALPFSNAKDPMSGFFALKKETFLNSAYLNPVGYKIGLELIVKCGCKNIKEIPIFFSDRKYGSSKLSFQEQLKYIQHIKRLFDYKYGDLAKFFQFCIVGATGAVVDLSSYNIFMSFMPIEIARIIAIIIAMTWNFEMNRRFTFSYGKHRHWLKQYFGFVCCCSIGAVVNWSVSMSLSRNFEFWSEQLTLAAAAGILCGTVFNFLLNRFWVYKKKD